MSNRLNYQETLDYSKVYHQKNREKRNQAARTKRLQNKLKAINMFGGLCFDCKKSYHPAVFEFHHLENKTFNLGNLMNWKWCEKHETELNKCILLCANCHRIRTYGEYLGV